MTPGSHHRGSSSYKHLRSCRRKPSSIMYAFLDWCFRSRVTGRITIAQFPNTALWLFLAACAASWLLKPQGSLEFVLKFVALGSAVFWATDELVRGVNPWRRALGLSVLLYEAGNLHLIQVLIGLAP